jgi:hypothetical protein
MTLEKLIPVLQVAIGPTILISGIGMLILSMTNRIARTIDRARALVEQRRHADDAEVVRIDLQLNILWRRAKLQRSAIWLSGIAVLLDALLMLMLFLDALARVNLAVMIALAFMFCMLALIASIWLFLEDINLALQALDHECQFEDRRP